MKRIWDYAFELGIAMMGILLVVNLLFPAFLSARSEERRVGKECRL